MMKKKLYNPCVCEEHKVKPYRPLTELILECWQREYDKRPYTNLIINRIHFEKKLQRPYDFYDFYTTVELIAANKEIKNLIFSYINIPATNTKLLERFAKILNKQFRKVCLINCQLPVQLMKFLAKGCFKSSIEVFSLMGNHLMDDYAEYLRFFIYYNKRLRSLNLAQCDLNEKNFAMVCDGVIKSKSMRAFDVSRLVPMSLVSLIDNTKIPTVLSQLLFRNNLTELHCRHCVIDSFGIGVMAEYLESKQSNLRVLDIGFNHIASTGVTVLFHAIIKSLKLTSLDISGNSIGSDGGTTIAYLMPQTRIHYLNIANNRISSAAICMILYTIKKECPLKILNISGNGFNSVAAKILVRQIDATVFNNDDLDVDVTFDLDTGNYRIVPQVKIPEKCGTICRETY